MPQCELQALIQELEQAEEGSSDLDYKIETVMGPPFDTFLSAYSRSIDAALRLYIDVPVRVPSSPLAACIEALSQRAAQ